MALFEVEHLTKRFGGLTAVDDVSAAIDKGEIVGLIGPNGAGKTTFFNLLTGFIRPDSGKIIFKGEEITRLAPYKIVQKGIARTFQVVRPFKHLPTIANVMLPIYYDKKRRSHALWRDKMKIQHEAARLLNTVGVTGFKTLLQPASNLSHGDLKRMEISRAIGTGPELLLMDEPFSGSNPSEIEQLSQLIKKLHSDGQTMIIVEHKLQALMKLVERVIVLHRGAKIAEGKPEEVVKDEKVIEVYMGTKAGSHA
jgi:branched-chain amino acid transport system ATP-binding protein